MKKIKFRLAVLLTIGQTFYPWLWRRHYLTQHQAKIPYWPRDIQQQYQIEADDPYIVYASINKKFNFHVSHQKVYVKD